MLYIFKIYLKTLFDQKQNRPENCRKDICLVNVGSRVTFSIQKRTSIPYVCTYIYICLYIHIQILQLFVWNFEQT